MTTMTHLPELITTTRVLVDPELSGVLAGGLLAGPAAVSLCKDRRALLAQAGEGTVVVLADPHPLAVDVLVRWGCEVVAVSTESGDRAEEWLEEVVRSGAVAALIRPEVAALQGAVAFAAA